MILLHPQIIKTAKPEAKKSRAKAPQYHLPGLRGKSRYSGTCKEKQRKNFNSIP